MELNGKFIAIGSGIKGISHMTMESVSWIKEADIVCYCVSDPATIVWIKQNAKSEQDLYSLYADDKKRIDTYHDMVDIMCGYVREGKTVAGVFYGHPGLFCYPTHTAITRLTQEGYRAWMLPGVSAVDCLFADAGFDPAARGIQMLEATDMLLRNRVLLTDSHVVLWQIGCVGDIGFRFKGYDGRNLGSLMDYLYRFYTEDTRVLHYVASTFPVCDAMLNWIRLGDLPDDKPTGISTLYIPPQIVKATDRATGLRLGVLKEVANAVTGETVVSQADAVKPTPEEMSSYVPIPEDNPIADFLNSLALNPTLAEAFRENPWRVLSGAGYLAQRDQGIIASRNSGALRYAMKQPRKVIPFPVAETPGMDLPDDFEVRMSNAARQYLHR